MHFDLPIYNRYHFRSRLSHWFAWILKVKLCVKNRGKLWKLFYVKSEKTAMALNQRGSSKWLIQKFSRLQNFCLIMNLWKIYFMKPRLLRNIWLPSMDFCGFWKQLKKQGTSYNFIHIVTVSIIFISREDILLVFFCSIMHQKWRQTAKNCDIENGRKGIRCLNEPSFILVTENSHRKKVRDILVLPTFLCTLILPNSAM